MSNLKNDPRLTAYALGELPKSQIKEFEMELQKDREAQKEVEKIQQTANLLKEGLAEERTERLAPEQRDEIFDKGPQDSFWSKHWKMISGLSTAVAALVLVGVNVTGLIDRREVAPQAPVDVLKERVEREQVRTQNKMERRKVAPQKTAGDRLRQIGYGSQGTIGGAKGKKNSVRSNKAGVAGGALADQAMVASEEAVAINAPVPSSKPARRLFKAKADMKRGRVESKALHSLMPMPPREPGYPTYEKESTEQYDRVEVNPFKFVENDPLSTFSIDVDTASYSNMRRFLNQGSLPPVDSIRIEEMINYFSYDYKVPVKGQAPFSVNTEIAKSPWKKGHKLVRIGLKGFEVPAHQRPASNLVLLLDVSGSMSAPNKLPLLKESFKLLLRKLDERDKVAIVVYAGASGMVLDSTTANNKAKILNALNQLNAGGSTNAGAGIQLAYDIAKKNFIKGGVNRVILATDGDFNVGITNRNALLDEIKKRADGKIFLTVLGLGMGNYKDGRMEAIANKGNGSYAYIDNMNEAKKVFVNDLSGTLITIAKDVKIQVEFNPSKVQAYRLVGYENRMLAAKDFNDDKKDAGEIGAGHTVTALYEIVPAGVDFNAPGIDKLKYQKNAPKKKPGVSGKYNDELLTVKLRYKKPEGSKSTKIEVPLKDRNQSLDRASTDFRFAVSVASFGMLLKKDKNLGEMNWSKVRNLAAGSKGADKFGYRQEFIELMDLAKDIQKNQLK